MMYNFIFSLYDSYWNFKEMEKKPINIISNCIIFIKVY